MNRQAGFSLIEVVMLVMVLALAAVPLLGQFLQAATLGRHNATRQTATLPAANRMEWLLGQRRRLGFEALPTGHTLENLDDDHPGFRRLTWIEPYTGPGCARLRCRRVRVRILADDQPQLELQMLLADY